MASEIKVDKIYNKSGDGDSGVVLSTNDVVATHIAGSEKMRVHSDGKVGIGTSSPNSALTVSATGGSAGANFEVASINADYGSATTNDSFGGYLSFRHRTGGNLLVEPARIGVVGTSNNQGSLVFYGKGGTASATAPTEAMRIDSSGLVSISNVNNTHNFKANAGSSNSWFGVYDDANDSANIEIRRSDSAQVFYVLGHTGNYHFAGSDTSDRDLKENIADVPDGSLGLVNQLKPRTFNFKESEGFDKASRTGFIAQEVASVMTTDHHVATGTDGNKDMGVDTVGVVAHLTKAIQELSAKNDALETQVADLITRVKALEAK